MLFERLVTPQTEEMTRKRALSPTVSSTAVTRQTGASLGNLGTDKGSPSHVSI